MVRRLAVFVRHLEEEQKGELLKVVAVAHAIVAQGVAKAPDFGNYGVGGHCFRLIQLGRMAVFKVATCMSRPFADSEIFSQAAFFMYQPRADARASHRVAPF